MWTPLIKSASVPSSSDPVSLPPFQLQASNAPNHPLHDTHRGRGRRIVQSRRFRWFPAMAVVEQTGPASSEGKVWGFFKSAFRNGSTASSSMNIQHHGGNPPLPEGSHPQGSNSVSSVAKSLLPTRRRLKLDPPTKLYFPCKVSLFYLVSRHSLFRR